MKTTTISIEEYLATDYRPDREYVDGVVVKRGLDENDEAATVEGELGTYSHSRLQAAIALWFGERQKKWRIKTAIKSGCMSLKPDTVFPTSRSSRKSLQKISPAILR